MSSEKAAGKNARKSVTVGLLKEEGKHLRAEVITWRWIAAYQAAWHTSVRSDERKSHLPNDAAAATNIQVTTDLHAAMFSDQPQYYAAHLYSLRIIFICIMDMTDGSYTHFN